MLAMMTTAEVAKSIMETRARWETEPEHYTAMAAKLYHVPAALVTDAARYEARQLMLELLYMNPHGMPRA